MPNRLQELREAHGLTRTELGAQIGVSEGVIARWETGRTPIKIEGLARVATLFDVSTDHVLGRDRDMERAA